MVIMNSTSRSLVHNTQVKWANRYTKQKPTKTTKFHRSLGKYYLAPVIKFATHYPRLIDD